MGYTEKIANFYFWAHGGLESDRNGPAVLTSAEQECS